MGSGSSPGNCARGDLDVLSQVETAMCDERITMCYQKAQEYQMLGIRTRATSSNGTMGGGGGLQTPAWSYRRAYYVRSTMLRGE